MRTSSSALAQFLASWAQQAQPGDRLPTIRDLMRRFAVSQTVVQQAFEQLKQQGLIASQVGRGTFFCGGGELRSLSTPPARRSHRREAVARRSGAEASSSARSVLLLRRSISIARGRALAEGLQQRFVAEGHKVLEVSYTDPTHAQSVLASLPRFDACMIQSTYRVIPIKLLGILSRVAEVVAVDGTALVGADVQAVGTEWGEPLALAVDLLRQRGHLRIACAMSSQALLATELGWRRFDSLCRQYPEMSLMALKVPAVPGEHYTEALMAELGKLQAAHPGKSLPFTALVAWGIDDGAFFRAQLTALGLSAPSILSVVLLGRTDLPQEHAGFFHTVGCCVADQIDLLHEAISARWRAPGQEASIRMTPVTTWEAGASVAPWTEASERRWLRQTRSS